MEDILVTDPETGLLLAFLLDGRGGGRALDWDGVRNWKPEDGVLWIHLDYSMPDSVTWLTQESDLDKIVIHALLSEDTRPRCDPVDNGLLVSLRGMNHNPEADAEDMVAVRLYVDSSRIVSTRQRVVFSTNDLAKRLEKGIGPVDSGDLLVSLSERLTIRMSQVITDLEDEVDSLEEKLIDDAEHTSRGELLNLRRQSLIFRRYLGPQREALNSLYSERITWFTQDHRMKLRESVDKLTRYVEELDNVRERTEVAYEELSSRLSDQLNKRLYLLSIITGIFLPLSFITGLLGINVGGIPLADSQWGFTIVVGLMLVTALGELIYFHRQKWL
jgi:zinc transporter